MNARQSPNQFLRQLSAVVNLIPNRLPNWTSESDFDVRTIGLEDGEIMNWVPERDQAGEREQGALSRPVDYLLSQLSPATIEPPPVDTGLLQQGQLLLLTFLFGQYPSNRQAVYKRPSVIDSSTCLYLLVRFGNEWIGLKTRVVET